MIPARFAPVLFGFILSGLMSCMVSAIATFRVIDAGDTFVSAWMASWIFSWAVAFPTVLLVAPVTRRIVARIVAAPDTAG
ncbi:DUF2798 domain-containing protein [Sulfitobacter sp. F26169L]|uniref:DUF2798 domain-containing protein n=1 Tax=Sulfitobacter sp. F26169L TaxID=2996015 RepID=UPI002260C5B9|nr:DUF2798 domain-containing protein [Sulfitobacter sp. F26169L]MCX7565729.1 DUF2798 domain-containing protein [Sulfitobacter sp. F26169L]